MTPLVGKQKKIVWILGAGFSRAVGLPLAKHLFSERFTRLGIGFATPYVWDPADLRAKWEHPFNELYRLNKYGKSYEFDHEAHAAKLESDTADALEPLESMPEHDLVAQHKKAIEAFATPARDLIKEAIESPASVELQSTLGTFLMAQYGRVQSEPAVANRGVSQPLSRLIEKMKETRDPLNRAVQAVQLSNRAGEMTAEEILVSLEAAAGGDYANQLIWTHNDSNSVVPRPWHGNRGVTDYCRETLNSLTRLIVAQLEAPIPKDLKNPGFAWRPFRHWASRLLSENDTIVTFNYDRVVETACALGNVEPRIEMDDFFPGPQLLKLHGCVTHVSGSEGVRRIDPQELRLQLAGIEPFEVKLGLPGESKSQLARGAGHLSRVWREAENALANADEIIFIGYSLPPEDVQAMEMIVNSIRARQKPEELQIKLVLGPGEKEAQLIASILNASGHVENTSYSTQHALTTWQRD